MAPGTIVSVTSYENDSCTELVLVTYRVYSPAARLGTVSVSGFAVVLWEKARKEHVPLLNCSSEQGSFPRANYTSRSLVAKVQSTVAPTVPVAVVVKGMKTKVDGGIPILP